MTLCKDTARGWAQEGQPSLCLLPAGNWQPGVPQFPCIGIASPLCPTGQGQPGIPGGVDEAELCKTFNPAAPCCFPTAQCSLGLVGDSLCYAQISRCLSIPCFVSSSDECLWTDWAMEKNNVDGRQAKHYACIKRSDGSCAWYRGMAPPKQEFLDIEDP